MADKKPEVAKSEGEAAKVASGKEEAARGGSAGGFQAWLPLLVTVVLMPLLAFATTKLLIIPRVVQARENAAEAADREDTRSQSTQEGAKEAREPKEAKEKETKDSSGKGHGKKKQSVPITKVIVNVAGSMGTRYLMTSFTLVGGQTDFKNLIDENKDQLLDLANTAMASKTISDLEKPGARNQLRSELISIFNHALGANVVQEIYFTEFAVQ